MGLYLTDACTSANCAPLAGTLQYRDKEGEPTLLAMLQGYVANQGDGWTWSLEYLRRHLEEHRTAPATDTPPANAHDAYLAMISGYSRRARPSSTGRWPHRPRTRRSLRSRSRGRTSTPTGTARPRRPRMRSAC